MNNIYKVIWSKAKNCYVVASEIAKSHTKSASGSEKMGGYGKRVLLALAAASAIFCGGLVNVGAADTVHVDESSTPATAQEVYTKAAVDTALDKKADKDSVYTKADTYTKTEVDTELAKKADAENVYTKADTYTKTEVNTAVDKKADKDSVYTKAETYTKTEVNAELAKKADASNVFTKEQTFTKDQVNTKLADYAKTTDVNTALAGKANVGDSYTKAEADGKFATSTTLDTAKNELDGKITANTAKITANETAITNLNNKAATTDTTLTNLSGRMTTAESDIGTLKADVSTAKSDIGTLKADMTTAKSDIGTLTADVSTAKSDINTLKAKDTELTGKIEAEIANRITSDTALDNKIDAEIANRITSDTALDHKIDAEIANRITSDTALDNKINTEIQDRKDAIKDTNDRTGGIKRNTEKTQTTIEDSVKVDNQGNVKDVKGLAAETITTSGNADLKGNVILGTNTANTVTVNGNADFNEAVNMDKGLTVTNGATTLKETTVDGKLTAGDADLKNTKVEGTLGVTGEATLDGALTAKGEAKFEKNVTVEKDLTVNGKLNVGEIYMEHNKLESTGKKHDSATSITADGISNLAKVTDENGNTTESKFTHNEKGTFNYAKKEGNTSSTRQDSKGIYGYAKDKDGNKSYTKQEGNRIAESVIGQDGKETKSEMTSTDITNTAKDGTIISDAKDIVNKATGNISNSSATMDTTVTGKATESYGELETEVKGNEKHTVKGDQTNEVDGKQINTIKNGQENIISGGQTNTITGDQTTTITGNKTETVTENVTEDYKKDLTTTVGGNETHEVKGTKTETIEGKVTENFKNGQETNVTGDQVIKVSGTQTTTATDINRNASSGMIDTIDNDYGTNTETKVAGKTTTDVSIKGTGEKGQYIRGANESRDYLINGTLKNSETKTVEKTSTEITDGNGKTSATIQDVNNLAGSVTNGTETGVSGIHAKDNSVSIDSIVTDGNKSYSVINQKKGSIQSTVVDGTSSTVILQDKDNVTIASSNGMVGIVGKDIVNNAQDTITNTAGTKITDKVGTNTRVIDSTSITDTVGTANRKIEDGKITDTAGDSTVTTENGKGTTFAKAGSAAYSTEAGATKDTNIAGNHITTGRVDANELGVSDKDDQGNTADLSVKAGEGIKSSATDKDGNTTYTKVTATENSFQVQDKDGKNKNHQVNTKDKSENTITNGDKTNTVTSTADGTTFNNSKANTAFEGGTYTDTTIKGNTITTGKVTMDYADVMKDLGVRGNANITGKTTTGSLEVTGTSTLKGEVTMESNATVKKDLKVEGTTTTKTLKVTENAEIDGNATIKGDVTARSYKVGDKTYIDAAGINANDQKITNVADGSISEGSKDAVNGGQLYDVKRDLEHQVDKVGANAAAMANLRPMEFDPSSKWNIAAAIGNYGSETAAALGAFYRPNDDVMVNLSTAFGTGENMVGGGVSVRLGKGGNKLSREENNALKDQVADLTARMDALLSVLNPNMSKDFPDVPENHWAYEAVSRLAGNDIVQGYPDGEFHGERTMTRYEMAEIIYNALSRGAEAEKELVEEFKPELQAMAASEKATAEKAEG